MVNQGKIIEYIEQGKIVCTLCLQDKGTRLHLLTPTNREVNLSSKRAMLVSDASFNVDRSREDLLVRLKEIDEKRDQLKSQVDVRELWELIREETQHFDHKYLAELCFGDTAADDHLSALVRALFDDRLYFRLKDSQFLPNPGERVEQIVKQQEEEAQREELLSLGGAWLRSLHQGKNPEAPVCKEEVVHLLISLALYGNEASSFKHGKELLQRAEIGDIGAARTLLIRMGVWDEDENLDLIRLGIQTAFTEEELREAEQVAEKKLDFEGREDLRHLNVLTIDGPMTRDFDDAVSLEIRDDFLEVGIHVADVAELIPPGTVLDRGAAERASSLYLPRRHFPMLPTQLSNDVLSLKEGLDRPAISLLARLDREGNLLSHRFVLSIVRVRKNLTYGEVNESLGEKDPVGEMHQLSRRLLKRRLEQGALNLSVPELDIAFGPDGTLSLELVPQDTPSRTIIAEFMILYNWLAARFCLENQIPVLYRAQAAPSERLTLNEDGYLYYVFQQRRKLNPLLIDTAVKPHSGLGLDAYTQSTSPIRRYLDLLVQRQMGNFLKGKDLLYGEKGLDEIRTSIEPVLKDLMRIKRNRVRYWILKYLREHRGGKFEAIMLYELKSRYRILLTDFLLIAEIKRELNISLNPAERILVEVRKADPWDDTLELTHAPS